MSKIKEKVEDLLSKRVTDATNERHERMLEIWRQLNDDQEPDEHTNKIFGTIAMCEAVADLTRL